ncbi:MAG: hypothetical protein JXR03_06090 [Cyclobacteriaceae bacterium]
MESEKLERLTSESFTQFVKGNENADVSRLLLGNAPDGVDKKEAAEQILSRKKAKNKLPNWHSQKGLVFPPPLSIEQSSSQKTAEYKKKLLSGNHIVDLTGGMGVDLICLSDCFKKATHVEISSWLSGVFKHNSQVLSNNQIEVVNQSAEEFLNQFLGKAIFFIDPARRDDAKRKVFLFEDCSPNVVEMLPLFEKRAEKVLVKAAPMIDVSLGINQLKHVSEIHVVSLNNECKEVLFLLDFTFSGTPKIHCVNLKGDEEELFTFDFDEEKQAEAKFRDVSKYLYEPNASIRKAGAFKSIASGFGLAKIAPNTHLYTSEELIENFPGRAFAVLGEVNKKNIKTFFPEGKANVISKNHPLTPEQIKKKFGLKDGGGSFLIGMGSAGKNAVLVSANRVNS